MSGHPWWSWALQASGLVLAYLASELNARLDARGFAVWMAANVTLLVVHVTSGLLILVVLDLIYIRQNIRAIQRWRSAWAAVALAREEAARGQRAGIAGARP